MVTNTIFTKSVCLLILALFGVFVVENANAKLTGYDKCIQQLQNANFRLNHSGQDALVHAYETILHQETLQDGKGYLKLYFLYLWKEAADKIENCTIKEPREWCLDNLHSFNINVRPNRYLSTCLSLVNGSSYSRTKTPHQILEHSFKKLTNNIVLRNDFEKMYYLHWKNEYILVIDTSSILGPDDFCRYRIGRRSQRPVQHEDRDRNLDQGDTNVIELNLFPNANTSSANVPSSSTSVVPQNEIIYIDEEDEDINLDLSL